MNALRVDVQQLPGGGRPDALLAAVRDGPCRREGEHTVWPLAVPAGTAVVLPTPIGELGVGAADGALELTLPAMVAHAWLATRPPPTRAVRHQDGQLVMTFEPAALDRVQILLPGVGVVGLRGR